MTKKKGFIIGGVALATVLGFTAFQTFADQTEPIEKVNEVQNASEVEESENKREGNSSDEILSIQEAIEAAQTEFKGKVIEIQLDHDDGKLIYEIELVNESKEAEIDLDAMTGDVLEKEEERSDREKLAKLNENLLSIAEAKEIAIAEFDGKVIEMELDEDDGRILYEVELRNGSMEAEMDIDAISGDIIEIEID